MLDTASKSEMTDAEIKQFLKQKHAANQKEKRRRRIACKLCYDCGLTTLTGFVCPPCREKRMYQQVEKRKRK